MQLVLFQEKIQLVNTDKKTGNIDWLSVGKDILVRSIKEMRKNCLLYIVVLSK